MSYPDLWMLFFGILLGSLGLMLLIISISHHEE
jgi:hypothetical protein